jgi:hypothetical protein
LEEYVREILSDATNQAFKIELREDGKRAGEDITIYDDSKKVMYHTAFSRLSRKEIEAMIKLVKKFDKKGKYAGMRLLPHSAKEIQDALERAQNGDFTKAAASTKSRTDEFTLKASETNESSMSPYGKWVREITRSQGLDKSIKDKYMKTKEDIEEEERLQKERRDKERKQIRQSKIQERHEDAMKMNHKMLKEYIEKQKIAKEKSSTIVEKDDLLIQV